MKTLLEVLKDADSNQVAIGHFNISDLAGLKGILKAASKLNLPIMIGTSEGEAGFVGRMEAAALVKMYREKYNLPVYLNSDHTHSLEGVIEAANAGYDEILFDGSKLAFEDNVAQTKKAVEIAKAINPNVLIEGEIGYIGSNSQIIDEVPKESLNLTTPEEAKKYVEQTGVDIVAPAVGNMHGLLKSMVTGDTFKRLNIELIGQIRQATGKFITLHGGSGTKDEDFVAAIKAGITIIHINSEIRLAWRKGVEDALSQNPTEITPYKLLTPAVEKVAEVVEKRLKLYNGLA
jgi:fructose-bisphosphate aldolase class II